MLRDEITRRAFGVLGELHPRWRQAYELPHAPMLFELDLAAVQAQPVPAFAPIARHQAALRDLALVVPESTSHDALVGALRADPSGLVRAATLFDVYKPAQPTADANDVWWRRLREETSKLFTRIHVRKMHFDHRDHDRRDRIAQRN